MSDDLDFSLPPMTEEQEQELEQARLRRIERDATPAAPLPAPLVRRQVKEKLDARIEAALIQPEDIDGNAHYDLGEDIPSFLRNNIGIDEAYHLWIGKPMGKLVGDTQMVSCPLPEHEDKNPSASLSLEKDLGNCHACDYGFDQVDLAAIGLGFDAHAYKKTEFTKVMTEMGTSLGFQMVERGNAIGVQTPQGVIGLPTRIDTNDPAEVAAIFQEIAKDTPLPRVGNDDIVSIQFDTPHGPILKPDSFLEKWLEAHLVTQQNIPPEYVLATGLMILGQMVGRNIYLSDGRPAYANASFVLYGGTGSKKSTAAEYMRDFLRDVEFWDKDTPWECEGSRIVLESNSGEDLIAKFSREEMTLAGMVASEEGVKGVAFYDEFSGLFGRAGRMGSTLKESLMQFMDAQMFVGSSSRSGGDLEATGSFVAALSTTQPEAIKGFLTGTDQASGFLNRWIYVPAALPPITIDEEYPIDLTEMKKSYVDLRGSWAPMVRGKSGAVYIEDDARRVRQEWLRDNQDLWRLFAATSRTELHLKRIALLFAINERETTVNANMMQRVLHFFETYLLPGFIKTDGDIHTFSAQQVEDEIVKVLEKRLTQAIEEGAGKTQNEILDSAMLTGSGVKKLSHFLKRKTDPELFNKTIRGLHEDGTLVMEKPYSHKKYRMTGLGIGEK